jgi:hypothetical protein
MHLGCRAQRHRAGPSCAAGASRRWACVHRGYGWTDSEVSLWRWVSVIGGELQRTYLGRHARVSTAPLCPTAALVVAVLALLALPRRPCLPRPSLFCGARSPTRTGGVSWRAVGRRALRRFAVAGAPLVAGWVVCAFALVVGRW